MILSAGSGPTVRKRNGRAGTERKSVRQKGKIMEKLWKRLETQMIQSYESMVKENSDVTVWNQAFDTMAEIVENGRDEDQDFAPELFVLDKSRDLSLIHI